MCQSACEVLLASVRTLVRQRCVRVVSLNCVDVVVYLYD